eukprot:s226_g16.t1
MLHGSAGLVLPFASSLLGGVTGAAVAGTLGGVIGAAMRLGVFTAVLGFCFGGSGPAALDGLAGMGRNCACWYIGIGWCYCGGKLGCMSSGGWMGCGNVWAWLPCWRLEQLRCIAQLWSWVRWMVLSMWHVLLLEYLHWLLRSQADGSCLVGCGALVAASCAGAALLVACNGQGGLARPRWIGLGNGGCLVELPASSWPALAGFLKLLAFMAFMVFIAFIAFIAFLALTSFMAFLSVLGTVALVNCLAQSTSVGSWWIATMAKHLENQ